MVWKEEQRCLCGGGAKHVCESSGEYDEYNSSYNRSHHN